VRLRDRIALVTGAASGIGAATARRFAREGATVAINDAKPEGLEAVAGEIRAAGAKVLSVNLKGTFLCAQAALPGMRERAWGRVVNTSSIGSLGNIGQANYAASKAGVIGLTKTLALEYAKYGVTVNAIAPGPVMTAMLAGVPEAIRERIIAQVPVGRIGSPDEIAGVHVFLASDDAAFITGQVIFADGGMSVGI
jgi:3-oxoacyl-[acyl-carrier protein] reductase